MLEPALKQAFIFCRFHPLSEFDEGKRSCRRRLAGHNRRRRKTQPEDVTSRMLLPGSQDNTTNGKLDLVNLLAAFARAQGKKIVPCPLIPHPFSDILLKFNYLLSSGKNEDKSVNSSTVPDRDQLINILNKINSLPLPVDLASKLQNVGGFTKKLPEQPLSNHQNEMNGTSRSTMDLLAVLSATLAASSPDALALLSQKSSQSTVSDKTMSTVPDQTAGTNLQKCLEFPAVGGERSSSSYQSPVDDSDGQVQDGRSNLPLQLFCSSPEDDSPPKLPSSRKYFSSDSSNPIEERSPSSSPVVQKLFPMQVTTGTIMSEKMSIDKEGKTHVESSRTRGMPLELFGRPNRGADNGSVQSFPYQAGYTSSSGSDHSPSSLNSDAQVLGL